MSVAKMIAAVGYGQEAEQLVRQANYIARCHGAKLELVHVVEALNVVAIPEAYGYIEIMPDAAKSKAIANKRLENIVQNAGVKEKGSKQVLRVGIPKNEIIDYAKEMHAKLIIVGSHEKSFAEKILGSTANAVLHKSPFNVLVTKMNITDKQTNVDIKKYKRILLAIEFMPEIEGVIEQAKEWAKNHNAQISLVHVINRSPILQMPLSEFEKEFVEKVDWQYKQLINNYDLKPTSHELILGSPAREIARYADMHNIDLIIMGSHGKSGLGLVFGSTANAVFHRATCDVLAVRLKD